MRHRKSGRKLKRTASHRKATLSALATALLRHKRITTTIAKAKETRMVVEKLITRAKRTLGQDKGAAPGIHARREVRRVVRDRVVVGELFTTIAEKVASRPGGYTRIVRLGQRQGDGAEMAVIELVDFNTGQEEKKKAEHPEKEKKEKRVVKSRKSRKVAPAEEGKESAEAPVKKSRKKKESPESGKGESQ